MKCILIPLVFCYLRSLRFYFHEHTHTVGCRLSQKCLPHKGFHQTRPNVPIAETHTGTEKAIIYNMHDPELLIHCTVIGFHL